MIDGTTIGIILFVIAASWILFMWFFGKQFTESVGAARRAVKLFTKPIDCESIAYYGYSKSGPTQHIFLRLNDNNLPSTTELEQVELKLKDSSIPYRTRLWVIPQSEYPENTIPSKDECKAMLKALGKELVELNKGISSISTDIALHATTKAVNSAHEVMLVIKVSLRKNHTEYPRLYNAIVEVAKKQNYPFGVEFLLAMRKNFF